MRLTAISIALLISSGCVEYTFDPDASVIGEPNPPDLSTPVQVDRIVQTTVPAVDVLWVIDNSCSMSEEQEALTTNFPKFMQFFVDSGLDYHVGVTSTDMDDWAHRGKLQPDPWSGIKYIDAEVAEPVPVFQRMADLGTFGAADEKGRAAAYNGLEVLAATDNAGFTRDDAYLSVVVISDEEDYSGTNPISLPDYIDWMLNFRQSSDMVSFSSIVGQATSGNCAWEEGSEYNAVTDAIGGIKWDICDNNWDQVLEALGMQAAGLRREFFLSEVPVADSIEVWIEEDGNRIEFEAGLDYQYDRSRNSILFASFVPNPLSEIFIEYEVLAGEQEEPEDIGDTGAR